LKPCYRREGALIGCIRCNYKAAVALQRPVRSEENIKEHPLVHRCCTANLRTNVGENYKTMEINRNTFLGKSFEWSACLRQNKRGSQPITTRNNKGDALHGYAPIPFSL
jgi:hypothetical protein